MKMINLFFTVLLITLFFSGKSLCQTYYIEQSISDKGYQAHELGQTFTTQQSGAILSISVISQQRVEDVKLEIFEGGFPCGPGIYQRQVTLGWSSLDWNKLDLEYPVYVKSNTLYSFLLTAPGLLTLRWVDANNYDGGGLVNQRCDNGSNWVDLAFKIEIDESQPPANISIKQGSTNLADGSTYGFGGIKMGSYIDREFTILNGGNGKLKLTTPISFESGSDPEFSIISQPASEVEPEYGASTSFTIRFSPTTTDSKSASLSIVNNVADKNPYNITFTGSGGYPEINIKQDVTDIADGGYYNYGNTDTQTNDDVIFTIENTGTALLILNTPLSITGANTDQFSITNQPSSEISAGGSATFTVRFSPTTLGSKTAAIDISNNDDDASPYSLTLNGTGVDVEMNLKQLSTNISDGDTYSFTNTNIGSNTDITFTIQNTGNAARSLTITTPLSITGTNSDQFSIFSQPASSVASGSSTTFTVRFAPTSEGSKSASIEIGNNDSDENPYNLNISGAAIGYPEMDVLGNDLSISDGANSPNTGDGTNFGTAVLSGETSVHTFTIKNTGNGTLHLNGSPRVSISGDGASDFSVTTLPSATVGPNNSTTTFQITFDPSANGARNAEISIDNDDSNENPYNFSISGIGDNQIAPYVTSYSPENIGTSYMRQNLVLQFNEEVTAVGGKNINIYDAMNNLFEQIPADDSRVTISGNQVTINPNGSFVLGTEYNVQIDAGAFNDIVGDTYDGIQNSSTWSFTAAAADPPGRCFNFDGNDDYATLPCTMPDNGTVEFWFYLDDTNTTHTFWNSNDSFWYMSYVANDALWCKISNGVLKYSPIYAGKWYHAAVTWQKIPFLGLTYSLHINGSFITSTSNETWINPNSTIYIGKMVSDVYPLKGKIEEFRIWNKARTITEIQNDMFKILAGSESNLLVYYKFDDMYGTELYDESGQLNNGTLFNSSDDSWITSTSPVGTYGKSVRTVAATTAGAAGKTISAQITSTADNTNYLGIYNTGNGDGKVTSDDFGASGATQRSNIIWGVEEYGSCTANLTFNYSNITGYSSNESALKLLKRNDAESAWTDVTGSAIPNTGNHTFTMSGLTSFSEFSIGDGGENPLPVELNTFSANVNDNSVTLKWQTQTEVDNYGFEIERKVSSTQSSVGSQSQNTWEKIGFIQGHGNSNSLKEYSFVDNTVLSGKYLYRLRQIDNDGNFKYSSIVEVTSLPTKYSLGQNYPNPFNPSTIIKFGLPEASFVTLKVYNMLGQEIKTLVSGYNEAGNYNIKWNGDNNFGNPVPNGTYIYRIISNNYVKSMKMILLK